MKYLDGVSDEDINKITHLNAMKHFQFDPFSVRPREKCTVGRCGPRRPTSTPRWSPGPAGRRRRTTTAS